MASLTAKLGLNRQAAARPRVERRKKPRPAAPGFWDRPQLINLVADTLLLFAVLALVYAALLAVVRLPFFPLRQVVVVSPLDQVTRTQVEYAVGHSLAGNFFTVDLDDVRTSFEKLPWVRTASVRRRWPDGVEVEIEEHVAVARWQNRSGEGRLVNRQGEVFAASMPVAESRNGHRGLPQFSGPEGSAAQVLARYQEFSGILAPLGREVERIGMSARQAWQLRLDDGLVLELGRDQEKQTIHERITRFAATYAATRSHFTAPLAAIDMRYPNGFALRSKPGTAPRGHETGPGIMTGKGTT